MYSMPDVNVLLFRHCINLVNIYVVMSLLHILCSYAFYAVHGIMIISRDYIQKGRRRISELQSSANHNLTTQAALQPSITTWNLQIDFSTTMNSHDEHHDIALDGSS